MLLNARTNYESETIHPLPYNETSFVFIGYDSREDIAYRVCEHSLIRRSSRPLTVIDLNHITLRKGGYFDREINGCGKKERRDGNSIIGESRVYEYSRKF